MVEVLEHVQPENVSSFLKEVRRLMSPRGFLIVTVPHVNKRLSDKHYQHFSSNSLREQLSDSFDVDTIMPFDRLSRLNNHLLRLLGYGNESNYVITNRRINALLYKRILFGCLQEQAESRCGRLLVIAKPKQSQ